MESTGVYWVPLFEPLERRGFKAILVDPRQTRQDSGRPKTDVLDGQWIQRLHSYGLLSASFRPDDATGVLRGYRRQRQTLVDDAGRAVPHLQNALEQMNVKLTEVVSDIVGVTGMNILKAIRRGVPEPGELAKYRHANCKSTAAEIARALQGNGREEHVFVLKQAMKTYEHLRRQLTECDGRIEQSLRSLPDQSGGEVRAPKAHRERKSQPRFAARELLFRFSGQDLTVIEGIDQSTALNVLAEIGIDIDMSKWPTEKHFASWLGLCPQHRGECRPDQASAQAWRRESGGAGVPAGGARLSSRQERHGGVLPADSGAGRGGKAVIATAHKIACRVYRLLKYGAVYVRQEMAAYEAAYRVKRTKGLARKAAEWGYLLVPTDAGATEAT